MNISGPAVKQAWKKYCTNIHAGQSDDRLLIVLHDELEREVGKIRKRVDTRKSGYVKDNFDFTNHKWT